VNTLAHLQEKFPTNEFCLIMGEDNLKSFHRWKNYEVILDNHQLYVYPRVAEGTVVERFRDHAKISRVDAPIIEISATFIRRSISEEKNVTPLLHNDVWKYIDEMNFYK